MLTKTNQSPHYYDIADQIAGHDKAIKQWRKKRLSDWGWTICAWSHEQAYEHDQQKTLYKHESESSPNNQTGYGVTTLKLEVSSCFNFLSFDHFLRWNSIHDPSFHSFLP